MPPGDARPSCPGTSSCADVTFGYSRLDPPLIEDFNLTLEPGERVALVGAPAAASRRSPGWSPASTSPGRARSCSTAGRAREMPRGVLANSLAVVDQDIFLFEGTVRENLTLWDATVPEPSVVQAAKDAVHPRRHRRAAGRLRQRGRGGRQQLQRRPAPAAGDRPRAGRRPRASWCSTRRPARSTR